MGGWLGKRNLKDSSRGGGKGIGDQGPERGHAMERVRYERVWFGRPQGMIWEVSGKFKV